MIDNHDYAFGPRSDDDGIAAVAGSFSGLHMNRGVEGITRRARTLSLRRRAMPAMAAVTLAAAAAAVVAVNPGHSPAPAATASAAAGNLALSGYTVQSDPSSGIITVTVKNFSDPSGLIKALAKYGVKVQLQYLKIPSVKAVRMSAGMMGTSGDTYYFGAPWTRQPDGTYQIQINVKVLGADRVQPLVVVTGYTPSNG